MRDESILVGHFAALNQHLEQVYPIFDEFCSEHGFTYVSRQSLGRYPRIRVERSSAIVIWFDLWMAVDLNGKRFERFSPEVPYELAAGGYFVRKDGSTPGIRHQKAIQCFSHKPFVEAARIVGQQLESHLPQLEKWDHAYLMANGQMIQLPA